MKNREPESLSLSGADFLILLATRPYCGVFGPKRNSLHLSFGSTSDAEKRDQLCGLYVYQPCLSLIHPSSHVLTRPTDADES